MSVTWRHALARMTWIGWLSLIGVVGLLGVATFGPLFMAHDPAHGELKHRLASPPGYPLGCNQYGQCVSCRLVAGARNSLLIGFVARLVAVLIGVAIGLLAGYYGGWLDWASMRLVEMFLAFPSLLLAIAISAVLGQGMTTVVLAIAVVGWAETARIIRGQTLELREVEFVLAARALGASDLRILLVHILPNCLPMIIIIFTMGMASAILSEASLSFLGLGVDPSMPTWGSMVNQGKDLMLWAPRFALYPGLCIAAVVVLFNLLGDELRDILDPRRATHWG